jgi:hypothetical protein
MIGSKNYADENYSSLLKNLEQLAVLVFINAEHFFDDGPPWCYEP